MKYLSKIMEWSWFSHDELLSSGNTANRSEEERQEKFSLSERNNPPHDVSVAHFEDKGGIYLMAFNDWSRNEVREFCEESGFGDEWERQIDETGLCVITGRIGKGEDIEIVHTSLEEIFEHEEEDT